MSFVEELAEVIEERAVEMPEGSYTATLLEDEDRLLEKIGEEAVELVLAGKGSGDVVHESADLIFHTLVLLEAKGASFEELEEELRERHEEY